MKNDILKRFCYGNVQKNFYKDNQELLDKTNYTSVRLAYVCATIIFAALAIVAILYPVVDNTWGMYSVLAVACAVITLVVLRWLPKHLKWIRIFYLGVEFLILGAAIAAGTYFSPNDLAVQFYVLLIILPLLYIEKPINSILVSVFATIVFCVCSYGVKKDVSYLASIDMLNAGFCLAIGVVFIYYVRNMHLENIQATMILQIQSKIDGLTGVLNKVSMEKSCQSYLTIYGNKQSCALLVLDIDDFKKVNDTLGHIKGDALLEQIGTILRGIFREEDIVGRIGGDEFMVLMKNIHDISSAEAKASIIINEIFNIFSDYSSEHFGCSIGIVDNYMQAMTFEEMYSKADQALYMAKEQGRGRYIVYSEER